MVADLSSLATRMSNVETEVYDGSLCIRTSLDQGSQSFYHRILGRREIAALFEVPSS